MSFCFFSSYCSKSTLLSVKNDRGDVACVREVRAPCDFERAILGTFGLLRMRPRMGPVDLSAARRRSSISAKSSSSELLDSFSASLYGVSFLLLTVLG